jgi:hypothetical protein
MLSPQTAQVSDPEPTKPLTSQASVSLRCEMDTGGSYFTGRQWEDEDGITADI